MCSASVINELRTRYRDDQDTAVLYVYCKYNVPCDLTRVLISLLHQLVIHTRQLTPESIKVLKRCQEEQRSPLFEEISSIFRTEMKPLARLFIVIDAFDECFPEQVRHALLRHMHSLVGEETSARLFITSRPHPVIENAVAGVIRLHIRASPFDIQSHIDSRISGNLSPLQVFMKDDPAIRDEIIRTVADKAEGMYVGSYFQHVKSQCWYLICRFLLADLHLNTLFEQPTKEQFKRALETLPQTVDALYQQTLCRIDLLPKATRDVAYRTLSWLTLSWRPLKMIELQLGYRSY
jgi:hypothetical protein